jgi:hypothetical protein
MINVGEQQYGTNAVTEAVGAAVVTKNIELTVDLANVKSGGTQPASKQDVLLALAELQNYIVTNIWPPA